MAQGESEEERKEAAYELGANFTILPNREQAQADLHRLSQDENDMVRCHAVYAVVSAFLNVPDKEQAWADLHVLVEMRKTLCDLK